MTVEPTEPSTTRGGSEAARWRSTSAAAPWGGVLLIVIGFVLISLAWGLVAGEAQVFRQMRHILSAAVPGLALVIIGAAVLDVTTRARDDADQDRQFERLLAVFEKLEDVIAQRGTDDV